MKEKPVLSITEVNNTITYMRSLFDIVRLVNPINMGVVTFSNNKDYNCRVNSCYRLWNKECRCSNCTSICSGNVNFMMSKNEILNHKSFHVVSCPIMVKGKNGETYDLVLEAISKLLVETEKEDNKILIVEDHVINRQILKRILKDEYEILEAQNGKEALEILESENGEILAIILDLIMPVMDGYELMQVLGRKVRYQNIPILITTANEDRENERRCLSLGAWEFITKPIDPKILKLRLKNIIGRSQFNSSEQIKYVSEHDPLTGLYNRAKFFEETRILLNKYKEYNYAFVRFDIDNFRLFNSLFGELQGNKLLKYIANSIRIDKNLNLPGTYGRIEGDIFGLCIPFDEKKMDALVIYVRELLKKYNSNYYIEPSFGIYLINDRTLSIEKMYLRASMAAEKCKNKYMTYVAYYDENMSKQLVTEQEIMNEAQYALDNEEFVVYFQPKYNLKTSFPCGAEALVRWQHPKKGLVPPGQFIPVFEHNNFIGKLDYYVWEKTCSYIRKWLDEGIPIFPVSVNISRSDLYNPQLIDLLKDLVKRYEIPIELLNLELTESAYMDNPDLMKLTVERLQECGFVVMMDDFGSGYSSLNTLKEIMVDVLKIDMKFLPTGESNGRSERILASVIRMAGWLELPVIVEGIETKEQKDFLTSIGCGFAQGYYFARPMPAKDYEQLLKVPSIQQDKIALQFLENENVLTMIWNSNPEIENIFKNILQPVAVYEYHQQEIIPLRVNQTFLDFFHYGRDNLNSYQKLYQKYISAENLHRIYTTFDTAINQKGSAQCDYMRILDDGKIVWLRIKLQYVQNAGDLAILFAVFTDITQEKILEQELMQYRSYLKQNIVKPSKMLIIDDQDISRAILKEIFKEEFVILEASNGKEGLAILEENANEVAIVLLDMMMPIMTGKEFLIKKNAVLEISDIPVVVISIETDNDFQVNMLRLGVNDYITKPFVTEIAKKRIDNVLEFNSRFRKLVDEYENVIKKDENSLNHIDFE